VNKILKQKQKFYNKVLRIARINQMYMEHVISLYNTLHESKRMDKLERKHGRVLDWDNKGSLGERLYFVPLCTTVKGKMVSLKRSRGITKAQYEAESLEVI
jgi:hypothetical protein